MEKRFLHGLVTQAPQMGSWTNAQGDNEGLECYSKSVQHTQRDSPSTFFHSYDNSDLINFLGFNALRVLDTIKGS